MSFNNEFFEKLKKAGIKTGKSITIKTDRKIENAVRNFIKN